MKRLVLLALAAGAALSLSACGTNGGGLQLTIDNFAQATVAQLQAADKIALSQPKPDLAASHCYEGMEPVVASLQTTLDQQTSETSQFTVPGPVDFQILRDGTKAALNGGGQLGGFLDAFNESCGWLKADVEKDVATAGVRLAPLGIKLPF